MLALPPVRRAACAVTSGAARATGWVVSTKGLIATSHSAIGYRVEVDIENESGDRRPGRVVWADVGRDLAFVYAEGGLPRGTDPMAPLALREAPAVKAGDRVHLVAALPGRGLRISTALICYVPKSASSSEHLDTDGVLVGPAGGPLVDQDGRAVGLLIRASPPGPVRRALALPAAEVREALRMIEASPEILRRSPIYRCPACNNAFLPEHDACPGCGAPLPHPFPPNPAQALAERSVRDALAAVGVIANRARTGPRAWHLPARGTPSSDPIVITLTLDEAGTTMAFRAPVSLVPKPAREPFYRLLLTLNDQATGPFRLALAGDRVTLVAALPTAMTREREMGPILGSLCETAEHYRKIFHEGFDAQSLFALDEPPEW